MRGGAPALAGRARETGGASVASRPRPLSGELHSAAVASLALPTASARKRAGQPIRVGGDGCATPQPAIRRFPSRWQLVRGATNAPSPAAPHSQRLRSCHEDRLAILKTILRHVKMTC